MEFFPDDTFKDVKDYNEYSSKYNNNWNLKDISTLYCIQDCVSLHQVLIKFSNLIWDKYQVNITKFPTLTSLTFTIFRTHFLGDTKIPMLAGIGLRTLANYTDIKMAYTGGATDMYIPSNITFFVGLKALGSRLLKRFTKLFYYLRKRW